MDTTFPNLDIQQSEALLLEEAVDIRGTGITAIKTTMRMANC